MAAQPADIPRLEEVGVNGAVVAVTFAIALATSLAFGILPALQFSGKRLPSALRDSTRGSASGGGYRMRSALVVAEMALAVVLLIGAGLLIRSFIQLTRVDPGFRAEQALSFRVTLQSEKYKEDAATPDSRRRVRRASAGAAGSDGGCGDERAAAERPRLDAGLRGRGMYRRCQTSILRSPSPAQRRTISAPSARRFAAAGRSPTRITQTRRASRSSTRRRPVAGSRARTRWAGASTSTASRARSSPLSATCCSGAPRSRRYRCSTCRSRSGQSVPSSSSYARRASPLPSRARFVARFGRSIPTWRSPTSRR